MYQTGCSGWYYQPKACFISTHTIIASLVYFNFNHFIQFSLFSVQAVINTAPIPMGGRCVGHEGHVPPRFFEANLKSLILNFGTPQIYIITINVPSQFS